MLTPILPRGQHVTTRQSSFGKTPAPAMRFSGTKVFLWSDFDGTWRDNTLPPEEAAAAKAKLEQALPNLKAEYAQKGIDLEVNFVTARPPGRLLKHQPPQPGYTITYNGIIHKGLPTPGNAPLQDWIELNQASGFNADTVLAMAKQLAQKRKYRNLVVQSVGQVVKNPEADASPFIATLCIKNESIRLGWREKPSIFEQSTYKTPKQVQAFFRDLSKKVKRSGMEFKVTEPYLFSGKPYVMFDIAAPKANKGDAIDFVSQKEGIQPEHVVIAADGGNDLHAMMRPDGRRLIVVGPNKILREEVAAMNYKSAIIQPANQPSSLGVLDGLKQHLDTIVEELQRQPIQFAGRRANPNKRLDRIA